jgi:hypothetical protein
MTHAKADNDRLCEFRSAHEPGDNAATSQVDSLKMLVKSLI